MNDNSEIFGYTYNSGTYGSSTYATSSSTGTTSSGGTGVSPAANGGTLSNTGFDILAAATLACLIICIALIIRFWKRPAKKVTVEQA